MNDQTNPCWGSTLDDFLKEEGIYEAAKTAAVLRVVAWQLTQEMERQGLSKTELAARMHTSRAQLDRVLKAEGNVTLETLQRAAALVGQRAARRVAVADYRAIEVQSAMGRRLSHGR